MGGNDMAGYESQADNLITRALAGDKSAITGLYFSSEELVKAMIRKQMPRITDVDVEILASKVLDKVLHRFTFDPRKGRFTTWIGVVAKRTAIDYIRKTGSLQFVDSVVDELAATDPSDTPTPSASTESPEPFHLQLIRETVPASARHTELTQSECLAVRAFYSSDTSDLEPVLAGYYPEFRRAAAKIGVTALYDLLREHGAEGAKVLVSDFLEFLSRVV